MQSNPAIVPIYKTDGPNDAITLYRGPIEIEEDGVITEGVGYLQFEWLPSSHIALYIDEIEQIPGMGKWFEEPDISLRLPGIVDSVNIHSNGSDSFRVDDEMCWHPRDDLKYVIFHVVNFHELLSKGIDLEHTSWLGRAVAEAAGWKITIDTIHNYSKLEKAVLKQRGYGITHAGRIERIDGSEFRSDQVKALFEALFWYFAFARGAMSPPILPVGFDRNGNRVWETWQAPRITGMRYFQSWFSDRQYVSQNLGESLSGFLTRWNEPLWQDTLKIAIHWYISANNDAGGVEGSIVLAQTGLEDLTWVLLVEDVRKFTAQAPDKFDRGFSAANKFRELLKHIGVSAEIPASLKNLQKVAANTGWADGPEAITECRNNIVHPSRRTTTSPIPFMAHYETLQLSLWYMELTFLHIFNYNGYYVNRISEKRVVGITEPVPWNTKNSTERAS